jgi:hypothetical protein
MPSGWPPIAMHIKPAIALTLSLAFAQAFSAMPSQSQLVSEMAIIREARHEEFNPSLCNYSQKQSSVLSCPHSKIDKEIIIKALNNAGWKLIQSYEVREWFFHTGEGLIFQKEKLRLSMYFFFNASRNNIESLYSY